MRLFLGVNEYTLIIGLQGDMRWVSLSVDKHDVYGRFLEQSCTYEI